MAQGDGGRVSARLRALAEALPDGASVSRLMEELGADAFGVTLAVLAVPALVPTPGIPAGIVFGTVLAILAVGMGLGGEGARLRLPGWIARRQASPRLVAILARHGAAVAGRLERLTRPRQSWLAGPPPPRWLAPVVFLMGVLIALPIPFGNTLPGFAVLIMGIGLAGRDGLYVIGGLLLAAAATALSAVLLAGGYWIVRSALAI